jgi:hypothetical protein
VEEVVAVVEEEKVEVVAVADKEPKPSALKTKSTMKSMEKMKEA